MTDKNTKSEVKNNVSKTSKKVLEIKRRKTKDTFIQKFKTESSWKGKN